jgi:hypothetical protein
MGNDTAFYELYAIESLLLALSVFVFKNVSKGMRNNLLRLHPLAPISISFQSGSPSKEPEDGVKNTQGERIKLLNYSFWIVFKQID